jgi:hypothetical protein
LANEWWTTGQASFAHGGHETIVRVGSDMYIKMGTEAYRPLTVTNVEQVPSDSTKIGILHFEDPETGMIGTLISEPDSATVCYSGFRPYTYETTIISERTRAQLPTKQRV